MDADICTAINKLPVFDMLSPLALNHGSHILCSVRAVHHTQDLLLTPARAVYRTQDLLRCSEDPDSCKQLNEAVTCMLDVLKCVNDSMHQVAISGFPVRQQPNTERGSIAGYTAAAVSRVAFIGICGDRHCVLAIYVQVISFRCEIVIVLTTQGFISHLSFHLSIIHLKVMFRLLMKVWGVILYHKCSINSVVSVTVGPS